MIISPEILHKAASLGSRTGADFVHCDGCGTLQDRGLLTRVGKYVYCDDCIETRRGVK